jgi:hypothetical protein
MQYTSVLYLIASLSAFPAVIGVMLFALPFFVLTKRVRIVNKPPIYVAVALIAAISIGHLFFNLKFFDGGLVLHLVFLMCMILMLKEKEFRFSSFIAVIKVVTIVNLCMLFSYFTPILRDIFYFEIVGFYRFQGAYLEPSVAAISSVFNIIVLLLYSAQNKKTPYILINLLIVMLTFSGSGLFLLLITLLTYLIKNFKGSILFYTLGLLCSLYGLIFIAYPENFLYLRAANVLNQEFSQSTYLRFFAPFEFISHLYNTSVFGFIFGISDPRLYIEYNHSDFQYFYLWHGSKTYQLLNGYAVLWGLSGLVGVSAFFTLMFYHWKNRNLVYNTFILFVPFFMGHFVSIMYWFYIFIFITINRRDFLLKR